MIAAVLLALLVGVIIGAVAMFFVLDPLDNALFADEEEDA